LGKDETERDAEQLLVVVEFPSSIEITFIEKSLDLHNDRVRARFLDSFS
jgi:hypothetical protein